MQAEQIKLHLIKQIMNLENIHDLEKIDQLMHEISLEADKLKKLSRPMRKKLNIEELKKEQNFRPIDKDAFFKKIENLDIQESIDELLAMI